MQTSYVRKPKTSTLCSIDAMHKCFSSMLKFGLMKLDNLEPVSRFVETNASDVPVPAIAGMRLMDVGDGREDTLDGAAQES